MSVYFSWSPTNSPELIFILFQKYLCKTKVHLAAEMLHRPVSHPLDLSYTFTKSCNLT